VKPIATAEDLADALGALPPSERDAFVDVLLQETLRLAEAAGCLPETIAKALKSEAVGLLYFGRSGPSWLSVWTPTSPRAVAVALLLDEVGRHAAQAVDGRAAELGVKRRLLGLPS
jgi:hypothetical protein